MPMAAMEGTTERVLQFGTGMLLRAISATAVDAAVRAGTFDGSIVIVQSTAHATGAVLNRQGGRFTLIERGLVDGEPVQSERIIDAISRVLYAVTEWDEIRRVAASPALRVIVTNVTEVAFRRDDPQPATEPPNGPLPLDDTAVAAAPDESPTPPPFSFPARLTDLLHARYTALPSALMLFVIPTELLPDNGPLLAAMVDQLAGALPDAAAFRAWLAGHVTFCSSLVDRITTGIPDAAVRAGVAAVTGFEDEVVTVTEPQSFWAIEGDPEVLRAAFPVDAASGGSVVFAADIRTYRERKLLLLNGLHTALAPLALRARVRTVREALAHPVLGSFARGLLIDEIVPASGIDRADALAYAESVLERLANPWLDHEWGVIATNQTAKLRLRMMPSITGYVERVGSVPERLVQALAASLRYSRAILRINQGEGEGWWQGASYRIVDVDFDLIDWHWRSVDSTATAAAIPDTTLARFAASVLADDLIWGRDLTTIPGLKSSLVRALVALE